VYELVLQKSIPWKQCKRVKHQNSQKLQELYREQLEKINTLSSNQQNEFKDAIEHYVTSTPSSGSGYTPAIDQSALHKIFNNVCIEIKGPFYFYRVEYGAAILYKNYIKSPTLNERFCSVTFVPSGLIGVRVILFVPEGITVRGVFTGFLNQRFTEYAEIILEQNLVCELYQNHLHLAEQLQIDQLQQFIDKHHDDYNTRFVATIKIMPCNMWNKKTPPNSWCKSFHQKLTNNPTHLHLHHRHIHHHPHPHHPQMANQMANQPQSR
jgi:hypothetical protein